MKFTADVDLNKIKSLRLEINKLKKSLIEVSGVPNSDAAVKQLEIQLEKLSKKLVEYQEKYAKLKKIQDDIGKSNNTTDDVKKSTAALQSTNKWIEANTKAIIEADNQIKIFKKDFDSLSADDKVGSSGTAKLRQIEQVVAKRMAEAESIRKNIKAQKDKIIQDRSEEGSITQLRKQLSLLIVDYDNMGRLRREGGAGKALLAQIKVVQDELSKAEQASGRFQRNVGNYSSAFNGLGMSIQQIARELPTLSMGANMFFLAISNNLPIFFDEVQRARKEYTAYIAELKKGNTDVQKVAPVWKQIASGIFSWNTALTVGVTLLTVYGKDIVEWVKELINGKEAVDAFKEAQKQLNEAQSEGIKNAEDEIIKLKLLRSLAEDESKHRSDRLKAVSELQRLYPDYLGNIDKEKILTGQVSGLYESLSTNIEKAAIARAKFDKAVAVAKEKDALQEEFTAQVSSSSKIWTRLGINDIEQVTSKLKELKEIQGTTRGRYFGATQRAADIKALQAISDAYDALINKEKELKNITENIDVSGLIFNPNSNDAGKAIQIQQKIADELLKLQATNQQREIDLMKEGSEKKIAQINLDYKEQIEAIKKQADSWAKEQGGTLTSEQTMQVSIAYSRSKKIKDRDISETYQEELDVYQEELNNLLKQYQGFDAKRRAIEDKYTKDLQILESRRTSSNSTEINASINELNYQKEEALNQIAMEFATRNEEFELWMNEIATYSLEKLQETLRAAQAELGTLKIAGGGGNKLAEAEAKVIAIQNEIANQNKKTNTSPEKRSVKEWQELYKTLSKVDSQFQEVGDSIGGTAGELLSSAGNISTAIVSMIDGIITLASGSIQAVEGVSKAAANAIRAVESASVILAIISAALQVVTKIFSLVKGKSKAEKDSERLSKVTNKIEETNEIINKLIEKRIDLIKEATSAERAGLELTTKEAIKAQQDLIQVQYSKLQGNEILGKKGKNNDLDVEDLGLTTVEQLKAFLENEKVWFNGAYTTLVELEKQGYGLTDKDKWYSIVEEWEKLNEQADELEKTTSEINTGINFDEARDGLDDFLLSADTTFKDISDNFEDYMRQSILNVVKSDYLNKEMQEWYKDFDKMAEDGPLSSTEVDYLRKEYENIYSEAQNKINGMLAAAGIGLEGSSSSQESSKKGFATASQDSIDSLEGRFTAGQIAWEETKNQAVMQNEKLSILDLKVESLLNISSEQRNIADETRTILANSYLELQQINENTGAIIKPITEMRDKMNSWDSKIRNM